MKKISQTAMFTGKNRQLTKINSTTQGEWLRDTLNALNISVTDLSRGMGLNNTKRIYQHLGNESHFGTAHLNALKRAFPSINLNYVIAGESPILLATEPGKSALLAALSDINSITNKTLNK